MIFRIEYIEFWSYNTKGELVRVLDDNGNELTLTHPWGTEIFNLCMTQNCDVMYITHLNGNYPEYQLKRTASNKFELNKTTYTIEIDKTFADIAKDRIKNPLRARVVKEEQMNLFMEGKSC